MRPPQRRGTGFRKANGPPLPLLHEIRQRADRLLDRHVGVAPVLVEEIDDLDTEPLQRGVRHRAHMLRAAVGAGGACSLCLITDGEAELGGDHDLVAEGLQSLADEDLIGERPIDLGRVEEVDAELDRGLWAVRQ